MSSEVEKCGDGAPFFFGATKYLRIAKTPFAGVFTIREPMLPWRAGAAAREKVELVRRLFQCHSLCAVWLDSRLASFTLAARALGERTTGLDENDWYGWFWADEVLVQSLVSCSVGGWACVFPATSSNILLSPVSPLPTDAEGIARMRERFALEVVIVSEIDDEWWLFSSDH